MSTGVSHPHMDTKYKCEACTQKFYRKSESDIEAYRIHWMANHSQYKQPHFDGMIRVDGSVSEQSAQHSRNLHPHPQHSQNHTPANNAYFQELDDLARRQDARQGPAHAHPQPQQHSQNHPLTTDTLIHRELKVLDREHRARQVPVNPQSQQHPADHTSGYLKGYQDISDQARSLVHTRAHAENDPHGHDTVNLHCQNCTQFRSQWQHLDCVSEYRSHWMMEHHKGQFLFVCNKGDYCSTLESVMEVHSDGTGHKGHSMKYLEAFDMKKADGDHGAWVEGITEKAPDWNRLLVLAEILRGKQH